MKYDGTIINKLWECDGTFKNIFNSYKTLKLVTFSENKKIAE